MAKALQIVSGPSPWETWVGEYLDEKHAAGVSRHTIGIYRYSLEDVLVPFCQARGVTGPAQLTPAHLNALVKGLLDGSEARSGRALSKESVDTYARTINGFLGWLAKRGEAPAARAQRQRLARIIKEVLSREEEGRMEDAAKNERDKLMIRILADTGMRLSELLALTPDDLRQETGRRWFLKVHGKGEKDRLVPIAPGLAGRIDRYLKRGRPDSVHPQVFLANRRARGTSEYEPLTKTGVQQMIRDLGMDVLGRRVYPHLFRHSFITWCAQRGMRETDVAKVVGHASLRMIHEVYEHLSVSDTHDALMRALVAGDRK
jgi:integrase